MIRGKGSTPPHGITAVLALALVTAAACGTASRPSPGTTTASPASASPSGTSPSGTVTAPAAGCDTGAWQTAPVTIARRLTGPPVPVITAVRTAAHPECGYDRLVLDITGPSPGYSVRYVTRVNADPSGKTITMPGHSYLLITLRPARAHADSGSPAISPLVQVPGHPVLTSWALAGDFEGVVTIAVGLQHSASIRVGELRGRLYVDLRN